MMKIRMVPMSDNAIRKTKHKSAKVTLWALAFTLETTSVPDNAIRKTKHKSAKVTLWALAFTLETASMPDNLSLNDERRFGKIHTTKLRGVPAFAQIGDLKTKETR